MSQLLSRFLIGVVVVVLLCAATIWATSRTPDAEALDSMADEAADVIQTLEQEVRASPVDRWWDVVDAKIDKDRYLVEFGDTNEFSKPTLAILASGKTDAAVDSNGYPFAQRIVQGTDQVITVSYRDDLVTGNIVGNRSAFWVLAGGLMVIPLLFGWLILQPLQRRMLTLENAARGFASGNFSTRVPEDRTQISGELGNSFNSMAGRIETLVAQNDVMLDEQREMLRAVAHEFRGPLARIRFALDMSHDAGGKISEELHHDMGHGLDELDLLVGEVLSYSRLQPGTPTLNFESVHFDEIVGDAVSQCELGHDGISITTTCGEGGRGLIEADAYYLQRAILNLLNNAARHSNGHVAINWHIKDDQCQLSVEDDGAGVPASWRSRIFDPFVRVDPSRSRNSGGVGLGLAIVSRIVQKHGGRASIGEASALGGAQFSLTWPTSPPTI